MMMSYVVITRVGCFIKRALFLSSPAVLLLTRILISSNKMKAILFLSVFIFFVHVTFSTPSETAETAENIDTAFQTVDDDDTETSDIANDLNTDNEIEKNEETINEQDVRIRLTPGKDIILTISPDGPANGGGVTYTRWGKRTCRRGTERIYDGYVGGGWYSQKGNGANYLCLPKDPQYLSSVRPSWQSYLYGAEFETNNKIFGKTTQNYNVPCAVCHVPRKSSKLVIPAKVSCPRSWTREYYGYLMTSSHGSNGNMQYECIDNYPDVIAGSAKNTNGALFYFVEAVCNYGLPCGPYVARRAITCAVCTK